tara:strand:- start:1154 stop:2008 length:855 start_codon:yes stop_codon:yes gene_type:complete
LKNSIKIGIIGKSIQYSLSPIIHDYWLNKNNIKGKYEIFDLKEENLKQFMKNAFSNNIKGLNVTIPYKNKIMEHLDEISLEAKAIGAVNTITVRKNGILFGDNTDTKGFINNLENTCPHWKESKNPIVVIGAGGAARAIIYSLINSSKTEIRLVNRNKERAYSLIKDMKKLIPSSNIKYYEKYNPALNNSSFLINTSSLGMTGHPDLSIDLSKMHNKSIVYDIVYSPLDTNLLKQAKKLNYFVVDGLGMLLEQAAPAFNSWFDKEVTVNNDLKEIVINAIKSRQ